jgi:ubiquinone/menaquinone biosynthesis C-methylase UbiE
LTAAVTNYFDSRLAAQLYAEGRPYFHEEVIERIGTHLRLTEPVSDALDVGCGTGLSTRALRRIARRVVGVDISAEMLAQAPRLDGITYLVGAGEALPVPDASFDLLTIASAFHWLDRERFLSEVRRVLRPTGAFIVYVESFRGMMEEEPRFSDWTRDLHQIHYPTPPRNPQLSVSDAAPAGFHLVTLDRYGYLVPMTATQLVNYLMSHSNALAVMESGRETPEGVRRFFTQEMARFYPQAAHPDAETIRHLRFGCHAWILRRDTQ